MRFTWPVRSSMANADTWFATGWTAYRNGRRGWRARYPGLTTSRSSWTRVPLSGRRADGVDGQAFAMGAAGAGRERPDVGKAGPRETVALDGPRVVRGSGVRRSRGAGRGCRDPRGREHQHLPAGGRSRAFRIVCGHDGLYATAGNQGCFAAKTTNLPCPTSLMSGCNRPRPELQAIVRTPMSSDHHGRGPLSLAGFLFWQKLAAQSVLSCPIGSHNAPLRTSRKRTGYGGR